jgi:hypothetical protein
MVNKLNERHSTMICIETERIQHSNFFNCQEYSMTLTSWSSFEHEVPGYRPALLPLLAKNKLVPTF